MARKPIRSVLTKGTSSLPEGPLGYAGGGNLIGGVGYFTISLVNGIIPVDGLEVGYDIESHSVERNGEEETHTFVIHAASENVARFLAKYRSSPTNVNFIDETPRVEDVVKEEEENAVFDRWRITTKVNGEGNKGDTTEVN